MCVMFSGKVAYFYKPLQMYEKIAYICEQKIQNDYL